VLFGNPETTTGGMTLKFYASVRLDLRQIERLKSGGEVIGCRVRARVKKAIRSTLAEQGSGNAWG
jgi:recombination protein RecA